MIHDLSGKEKSALLGAAEIALGLMGAGVEAPRVPRPDSERPLSAEETAGHAMGDPFNEYGFVAAGKRRCGLCGWKAAGKGEWRCTRGDADLRCPSPSGSCPLFLKKPSTPRPPQPKKKGFRVPEGFKFLYFGRPELGSREQQGVVTVAWIESSPGTLVMGFAFCSPKDPWCKATGRDMAIRRLYKHPLVIPFLYDAKRTVHDVVRAVLTHDFGRIAAIAPGVTMWGRVPSWTRGLGKRTEVREACAHIDHLLSGMKPVVVDFYKPKPTAQQIVTRMMRDITQMEDQ